jgi:hypothetical protein
MPMRIATWNCCRGSFKTKRAAIDELAPDIVVLTESAKPEPTQAGVLWFGSGRYGVAMYVRPPFEITRLLGATDVPCVYAASVSGPLDFTLLGVWTWSAPTYKEALIRGLENYSTAGRPWVIAGDFNGNPKFDRPRTRKKWSDCFATVMSNGVVSAYHVHNALDLGADAETPTHYFRWNEQASFHIDYCFLPSEWRTRIRSARIASYAEFAKLSDHRPVIVDVGTT